MENENRQNKPRTIQMKYPAPYSQSWTEANKRTNRRAAKIINENQIVNSLPFSNFGPAAERKHARQRKVNTVQRRLTQKQSSGPFTNTCCHANRQRQERRPDPTVPHLKYGLFSKAKNNPRKGPAQVTPGSVPDSRSHLSTPEHASTKKDKKTKGQIGPQAEGSPPMLVFRAIDPRYTRQLSVSPPTHLDIRPRVKPPALASPHSPRYSPPLNPSANFLPKIYA